MIIPQEVLESRVCEVYSDTDPELLISLELYNGRMLENRLKKRKLALFGSVILSLNIIMLVIVGIIGMKAGGMFLLKPRVEWLESAALVMFAAAFVWFGFIKRNFIALTVFSVLLIFMDMRCVIITAADIFLTVFYMIRSRTLVGLTGYPDFYGIRIKKNNCKQPKPDVDSGKALSSDIELPKK